MQPLRDRHGDAALQRITQALGRHVGRPAPRPSHPLQEPASCSCRAFPTGRGGRATTFRSWPRSKPPPTRSAPNCWTCWPTRTNCARTSTCPMRRPPPRPGAPQSLAALERLPLLSRRHPRRRALPALPAHRRGARSATAPAPPRPWPGSDVFRPASRTHIPPHTGVINGRLTVHLPLIVPPDCGALAVAGQARPWQEGHCLVFDDSYVHEAWDQSGQTRVVLSSTCGSRLCRPSAMHCRQASRARRVQSRARRRRPDARIRPDADTKTAAEAAVSNSDKRRQRVT